MKVKYRCLPRASVWLNSGLPPGWPMGSNWVLRQSAEAGGRVREVDKRGHGKVSGGRRGCVSAREVT